MNEYVVKNSDYMMNRKDTVVFKKEDRIQFQASLDLSYETADENIKMDYSDESGFSISILNKSNNILSYYRIVDGLTVLDSMEDVITGETIENEQR